MIHTITANAGKKNDTIEIKTTFRLYRQNPDSFRILAELSSRIFRETRLETCLLLRGDKTIHLTFKGKKLTKEALLRKVETAIGIIREVYEIPQTQVLGHIQQGLF